ncbi:MAG: hypothetical protein O3A00_09480 [Planctomycetota bacterium]|nr:hypothetical protein [Planctomycetota bacterium]
MKLILWLPGLICCFVIGTSVDVLAAPPAPVQVIKLPDDTKVSFGKDIRPILQKKCFVCHSGNVQKGGLDLGSFANLMKGGDSGAVIQPGASSRSSFVQSVGRNAEPFMPPPDEQDAIPFTPRELALVKLWIDQGATAPTTPAPITFRPLPKSVQIVRAIALAADKSIVVSGRANQIHIYQPVSGKYLGSLRRGRAGESTPPIVGNSAAHASVVEALAISPDSGSVASGSFAEVVVSSLRTGQPLFVNSGFAHRVVALDFSPDGRYVAAVGGAPTVSGEIKVLDAATGSVVLEIPDGHSDTVYGVRFSPDGRMLATCGADLSINLFSFPDGRRLRTLDGHTHHVLDVAWQADGRLLASAGADKKVRLWDLQTGEQLTRINRGGGAISTVWLEHSKQVSRVQFIGRSTHLLTCNGDEPVADWHLEKEMRTGNYAKPYFRGRSVQSFGEPRADYRYAAAASNDRAVVAIGGRRGTVRLFNGLDGKPLHDLTPPESLTQFNGSREPRHAEKQPAAPQPPTAKLQGHHGYVSRAIYSPDGKTITSAGFDGTVRLWEAESHKPLQVLAGHDGYVRDIAFSLDGSVLVSCGADERVIVWNVANGREQATLHGHVGDVNRVCFLSDGTLCSAGRDGTICLWDISNERRPSTLAAHSAVVRAMDRSPDGGMFATVGDDHSIKLWDSHQLASEDGSANADRPKPACVIQGHADDVLCIAYSADGQRLVSASADGLVKVWDAKTGSEILSVKAHAGAAYSAAFSRDGKTIASAGADQLVKTWDATDGKPKSSLKGHTAEVYRVVFSGDGGTLASASHDMSIRLWDAQSGKPGRTLKGHQGYVRSVVFSPDNLKLATASADRTLKLWDLKSGKTTQTLSGHTGIVFDVAFSSDGKTVASASDGAIKLWDVESGKETATLLGHTGDVYRVMFEADGRHLVSCGEDGTVRRWSTASGRPPQIISAHRDGVASVAAAPSNDQFASCGQDGLIKLWTKSNERPFATLQGHSHLIVDVQFSPDGKTLASASHDGTLKLWDVASKTERQTFRGHDNLVTSLGFGPNNRQLVSTSYDGTIRMWDLKTATSQVLASGLTQPLSVRFSPSGRFVISTQHDSDVLTWKVPDGR